MCSRLQGLYCSMEFIATAIKCKPACAFCVLNFTDRRSSPLHRSLSMTTIQSDVEYDMYYIGMSCTRATVHGIYGTHTFVTYMIFVYCHPHPKLTIHLEFRQLAIIDFYGTELLNEYICPPRVAWDACEVGCTDNSWRAYCDAGRHFPLFSFIYSI